MFYDLNVPWPSSSSSSSATASTSASTQASTSNVSAKKKAKNAALASQPSSFSFSSSSSASAAKGKAAAASPPVDPLSPLDATSRSTLTQLTHDLSSLGYSTLAYNLVASTRYDPALHNHPFTSTSDGRPSAPFPSLDPRTSSAGTLTQLSRLTLTLTDQSLQPPGHGLLTSHATSLMGYDLLSVQPTSEATFQHACLTLSELRPFAIDIISLDLASSPRLPWLLKRSTINAALENGVMFEVCYSSALSSSSSSRGDSTAHLKTRRNLISNTRDLLRVTNGRGILFSSAATNALQLRGPYDVINLAAIFGMSPQAARDAVQENPRQLIVRARTRKSFRGVVGPPVVVVARPDVEIPIKKPDTAKPGKKKKQVDEDNVIATPQHKNKRPQPDTAATTTTGKKRKVHSH